MQMEVKSREQEPGIRVYKFRWVILTVYALYSAVNFAQYLEYSIISNVVMKYYGTGSMTSDLSGLIVPIVYIATFIPANAFIEKYNLRYTSIAASGLTTLGCLLKLVSLSPDRFYVVVIGQALSALGQVLLVSIPSKIASIWFGPEEVSTACAIGVVGTQMGLAVGVVFPTLVVRNSDVMDEIEDGLFTMVVTYAVLASATFILTLTLFKAKPDLPPSLSQQDLLEETKKYGFLEVAKQLIVNRDFLILVSSFGMCNGIWTAGGVLLNEMYLHYFPGSEQHVGLLALIAVVLGGCFGGTVIGYILDKTHKFKVISFVGIFMSAISYSLVTFLLEQRYKVGTYVAIPLYGLFCASTLVTAYEYVLEVTYPIPEEVSCSLVNAVVYLSSMVFTFLVQALYNHGFFLAGGVVFCVIFYVCAFSVLLVSTNLRRREANQGNNLNT